MPSPPLSIVQALSPRIAVLTSDDVIDSCEANGCRGLEELLRPWEGGSERVSILSSTLTPGIHPTFPLRFVSFGNIFPVPETSAPNADIVVDLISSFVGVHKPDEEQHYPLTRSLLLSTRPTASYESFNHPVGILLAISTSTPEPLETLQRLVGRATGPMAQAVPWLDGVNVMRFFVVIHDVAKRGEDMANAHNLLASVKKIYGPHSTLLVINSQNSSDAPPLSPDTTTHPSIPLPRPFTPDAANPSALSQVYASALSSLTLSPLVATSWLEDGESPASNPKPSRRKLYGSKLTADDTQRLAALVRELVVQSLVPWMEGKVREWNEVWQSNRRGITGRLFGAGRKFFSSRPSSPAPNAPTAGYNAVKGYYPVAAVESLTRRLADFAFMLRDYRFAATVYDSLRRDFAQDRAWRYAAAATEIPSTPPASPSSTFTTLQHTDISSWLEQAVLAYQERAPANQIQLDALRITTLYYEAWKAIGEWRGVGAALVKAAGEADEAPSAVMIEEAASADVKGGKSGKGIRRRAFHLVLAARRYETAGLKQHSQRCLERASHIYRDAPWTAAQDQIEYSLGRQAYTSGESDVAVEHFLRLLRKEDTAMWGTQGGALEDMALAYEQLAARPEKLEASKERLQLPTPIFDVKATKIVLPSSHASCSGTDESWAALSRQVLSGWDRKGKKPMTLLPDTKKVVAAVDETFHVELLASNPLNSPLALSDLKLITSSPENLEIDPIEEITLEPYESRTLSISVTARQTSTITIEAVSFSFHRFFPCTQPLEKRGQRLHDTKQQRVTPTYAKDTSLTVEVGRSRPRIEVDWPNMPEDMYEREAVEIDLRVRNTGKVAVENLQMILNEDVLRMKNTSVNYTSASISNRLRPNPALSLHSSVMQPGETLTIPLIVTPTRVGMLSLLAFIIFANAENENDIGTSTLAHTMSISPLLSLQAQPRYGRSGPNDYFVGLEVSNASSSAVKIDDVQSFSSYWTVTKSSVSATLLPNQTLRVQRSAKAGDNTADLGQIDLVNSLSKLVQGQTDISKCSSPGSASLRDDVPTEVLGAYLASRQSFRLGQLQGCFPTIPLPTLAHIAPLIDPLDLDFAISWSLDTLPPRTGTSYLHGIRISPEFSIVETIRREIDDAISKGGKTTRTMYEETGRLRQVLMDSVLDGMLSHEDDPVELRVVAGSGGGKRIEVDMQEGGIANIVFSLKNRSPALSVRWVLDLPKPGSGETTFGGMLSLRGTLAPGGSEDVKTAVRVEEPGMTRITGWVLRTETGEGRAGTDDGEETVVGSDAWEPRRSWSRGDQGEWLEVVSAV